jgi:L-alanine-DL-glutamate epimerase-like enolase superfamily enzyme
LPDIQIKREHTLGLAEARKIAFNLARFDFVSVRLAVACAQTGSLTGAARASHLALAAASRRIRELEEAHGMHPV